MKRNYFEYLRRDQLPTVWCPGCGNGIVAKALAEAFGSLGLDKNEIVLVGGIGCSGRTSFLMDVNTIHAIHGRVLAFAAGIKMVRPELTVLAVMGDGDSAAIGGNHLIHAARRNVDLTAIVFNNGIYGQTGGQIAPTTPRSKRGSTAPGGNIEPAFDLVQLLRGAGAGFIARSSSFDYDLMVAHFRHAIQHPGFSFVDVLTMCPTYFGRLNELSEPYDVLQYIRNTTAPEEADARRQNEHPSAHLPLGIFHDEARPTYGELYAQRCEELRQEASIRTDMVPHPRGNGTPHLDINGIAPPAHRTFTRIPPA
jgi:2-oxoglutarate/2-oxoacid ferredoxin oxidoreductase subunit beta